MMTSDQNGEIDVYTIDTETAGDRTRFEQFGIALAQPTTPQYDIVLQQALPPAIIHQVRELVDANYELIKDMNKLTRAGKPVIVRAFINAIRMGFPPDQAPQLFYYMEVNGEKNLVPRTTTLEILARRSGYIDWYVEHEDDEKGNPFACTVTMWRKDKWHLDPMYHDKPYTCRYTIQYARRAGKAVDQKNDSAWYAWTQDMLYHKAFQRCFARICPELAYGYNLTAEIPDQPETANNSYADPTLDTDQQE